MLPTKFRIIWPCSFREDFQKSANQKQELPVQAMFVNGSGRNEQSLQRTLHRCFLASYTSFSHAVSEEKNFQKSANQKQELPVAAMFVNGSGRNEQSLQRTLHRCFLPSYSSFSPAVSEKIFQKSANQKQELPGPYIDTSYQVSVHLVKGFQRKRLKCEKFTDGIRTK